MNDRLARLRQETQKLRGTPLHDEFGDYHDSQGSSKNSDSHLSPRSTNASRQITDETMTAGGQYQSSQLEFYKSETSFKNIDMSATQGFQRQPTLAQSLKQRREFKEVMDREREAMGVSQQSFARNKYTIR